MSTCPKNLPKPQDIAELRPLLELVQNDDLSELLLRSLNMADDIARNGGQGIDPLYGPLYDALPWSDTPWPTTIDEYIAFLASFVVWIPQQSSDPAWLEPDSPLGEHQEVYDRLCFFYWLVDQPVGPNGQPVQDIPEFRDFLVLYARAWGRFLDTTASFDDDILETFRKDSPKYRVEDSMIGDPLRPNNPSGWKTFNQFFARELNPGLRPITDPTTNTTVTVPADCTFKAHYEIDGQSQIEPPIIIKGTHTYAGIPQLLEGSAYKDAFANGHFIHLFLGPYSYHRFHTPVAGTVKECYPLTGEVYLRVQLGSGQFVAADSAKDGYEFLQARGILTIDTAGSPYGDVGVVAVIPVGMCQVSGVNMTHVTGTGCLKGDEFGYFTFGASDIIILLQRGTNPQWNPQFTPGTTYYSHYGTLLGNVTKKS